MSFFYGEITLITFLFRPFSPGRVFVSKLKDLTLFLFELYTLHVENSMIRETL